MFSQADVRYCSTCKRYVNSQAKFAPNRKTCSPCLERARERAWRRRLLVANRSDGLSGQTSTGLLCKSCKCFKSTIHFARGAKTCKSCKTRRQNTLKGKLSEHWHDFSQYAVSNYYVTAHQHMPVQSYLNTTSYDSNSCSSSSAGE